jgi:hypothetical protein
MFKPMFVPVLIVVLMASSVSAFAECPACAKNKLENGWCNQCKMGYFSGIELKSKKLLETLEGKPVADEAALQCPACKTADEKNGVCEHCKIGYANHRMYPSIYAYCLALGTPKHPEQMKCPTCKSFIGEHGWCDECKQGIVGRVAFQDKEAYNKAVAAREIIQKAAKLAEKCESCALALVTNGVCEKCNISYKDGKPVENAAKSGEKPNPNP